MFLEAFCSPDYQPQQQPGINTFPLFGLSHITPEGEKKLIIKLHEQVKLSGEISSFLAALIVEIGTLSEFMNEASEMISAQTDGFPR